MCFSLCCKIFCPSMILSVIRRCGPVFSLRGGAAAASVGPVRGAAVARLVDLALLLQAVGLAALAWTPLNTPKHSCGGPGGAAIHRAPL